MKFSFFLLSTALLAGSLIASGGEEVDFSVGIFVVNEDWYGHHNSTVNFLVPDDPDGNYWHYRVIQEANPSRELGCTNQFGALWEGRLYLIAKQDKDPGADITGGRITVADARTMEILHQQRLIDPSGAQCDGRGFIGVDAHKGYISTSNGIWVFNLDTFTVSGQIEGSANPNAGNGNDRPNTDPTGSLYHGQTGSMVAAAGRVFAAHQQYGLLVIDPATDKVIDIITMDIVAPGAGIGSVVKAKDGSLWISVAKDVKGTGATLSYLVKVDPETLDTTVIEIPADMYPPANSWYAWTPDAFVASTRSNILYWKGGPNRWFAGSKIYKYDIEANSLTLFADLDAEGANWKIYGCSLGVDPDNDEVYMSLYHEFGQPVYITRRYAPDGTVIKDYPMISNYWFPSHFIFTGAPGQSGIGNTGEVDNDEPVEMFTLSGLRVNPDIPLAPGIYIKRSGAKVTKVLIR